jgi:hypothetical protein
MEQKAAADPGFSDRLAAAHESYRLAREELAGGDEGPAPSGGVGGARDGVKCLHAHYAHTRAGGDNPVGELVAAWIEPLDCPVPCVVDGTVNPAWRGRP